MANAQLEAKLAVDAGYWFLYRYNPDLKKEGKNPFILDSKEPSMDYNDFIMGEVRYASWFAPSRNSKSAAERSC